MARRLPQSFTMPMHPSPLPNLAPNPLIWYCQLERVMWADVWAEIENAPKVAYLLKHWRKERDSNPRYR